MQGLLCNQVIQLVKIYLWGGSIISLYLLRLKKKLPAVNFNSICESVLLPKQIDSYPFEQW